MVFILLVAIEASRCHENDVLKIGYDRHRQRYQVITIVNISDKVGMIT